MNAPVNIRAHRPVVIKWGSAYDWRTEPCECDGGHRHGMHRNGPATDYCTDCNATGKVDAACVECERIVPLDSEGTCLKCVDSAILPLEVFAAKYHPRLAVTL